MPRRRDNDAMNTLSAKASFLAPRALAILFILFVSMFALDVFGEGRGFWQTLTALGMHLIPSFVLVGALVIAWRWEWAGAIIFAASGTFFFHIVRGHWWGKLLFASPCFLTAWLFLVNWRRKREQRRHAL